jgi:hypothetical protein
MIPLRYNLVRTALVVLTLLFIIIFAILQPVGGGLVVAVLLVIATAIASVAPAGVYGWLFKPVCPECGKKAEWITEQGRKNPYHERLIVRCAECDWEKVELSFDPTA